MFTIILSAIWTILDMTPEGRGVDWYPKLNYVEEKVKA